MTISEVRKADPLTALREVMQEIWDKSQMEGEPLAIGGGMWRAAREVLDNRSFEERDAKPLEPKAISPANEFILSRFCKVS